ncbi:hypothetical protein FBU30_009647 [Linnemannia zychae]|nr:hypothetical protein FBU30_009647 [Linnemannia zychae]
MASNTSFNPTTPGRNGETATSRAALTGSTPGPWRPASLAGRNSPAPGNSPILQRDHGDSSAQSHNGGMPPLRPAGGDRPRMQPTTSSTGAWVATSRRAPSTGQDRHYNEQSHPISSSPILGSSGTFARQAPIAMNSTLNTSSGLGNNVSAMQSTSGSTSGNGVSSGTGQTSSNSMPKQPLNMEALAAKFADSKETKEKFATLQLSPALVPSGTPDKERRNPMGVFAPLSSGNPHVAHIKVQRTTSLTHPSQPSLAPKGNNKLQTGLHVQSTDMRRTASHNNAFSSGLGAPVSGGISSGHINNISPINGSSHSDGSAGFSQASATNSLSSSPVLAPFSLGQMTRSTRRSSLNPQESVLNHHQDHPPSSQTSALSPSMVDRHPLQHPWTLYYDSNASFNRLGSSQHNYENNLRDLGTFTTVELFARYFNWIEKPHKIENSSNYHLFKDGIKPMWEDPANASGGRWVVTLLTRNAELLDRCWMELAYALVGEQLDLGDDICGAVLSRRTKADRLAVWVRDKDNIEAINGIGKRLIKILDLSKERISLEFQITTDSKSTGFLKNYITLETIKKELAQEAEGLLTFNPMGNETTPSLTIDSVSATPASASEVSPAASDLDQGPSTQEKGDRVEAPSVVGPTGLLISVDGKGVFTS